MRKYLRNTDEVFHYWANQLQERGQCGNVSFEGGIAFSYARDIARIHKREDGQTLVLFGTAGRDSPTTSGHISAARSASCHLRSIRVPYCNPHNADHTANLQGIIADYNELMGKAKRARLHGDHHRDRALERVNDFNAYAMFFGRPERFSENTANELAKQVEAERKELEAKRKAAQRERDKILAQQLAEWREGKLGNGGYNLYGLSFVALRLGQSHMRINIATSGDLVSTPAGEQVVQTSMGAEIPVSHAKRLWPKIVAAREGKVEWKPSEPVGVYRLSAIRNDGSMVVGCHDIPYSEIERIAKALGLVEEVTA